MKLYLLFFALCSTPCFAQNKDYSIFNKDQLIESITMKDKEYKALKDSLEKLRKVIKDNNEVFLREVFQNKYTAKYFQETELEPLDKTDKIRNSNILINSIRVDADQQTLDLSAKALAFNKNYLTLFEIRKSVLNEKFDEKKVKDALILIDSIPALDSSSTLNHNKKRIVKLLHNYKENTCLLQEKLNKFKGASDQKVLNPSYTKLENDTTFKDYPFLISVIVKMKKDSNTYIQDSTLLCNNFIKASTITPKIEGQEKDKKN